jgi:predicted amidohydrolase YtcJ
MPTADRIFVNGAIRTMDPLMPQAQALALSGDRILALGSDDRIRALAGPRTEIVDLGGRPVLPGFHDTHLHVQDGGHHYVTSCDLSAVRTPEEMVRALRDYAARHDYDWILGGFYYAGVFAEHNLDRHLLDRAVPDRPCYIMASDGHNGCINSRAIEIVGLTAGTPDPDEGHFVRDARGEPTGLLHERATHWVDQRKPPHPDAEFIDGVLYAQAHANRHGITGVLDASVGERHARVYKRLVEDDALTVRVLATARVDPSESTGAALERVSRLRAECQFPMFRIHSAKFFLDGVIENRTAAMIDDYSDARGGNFPLMFPHERVLDLFTAFDAARFQIHVHAIGDMAVRAALDGFEAARRANAPWPSLHHIAHIQFIDPSDIPRFAELGAVANVQPLWARNEPSVTELSVPVVGPDRSRWIYAFRSLREAGALMTISSDWTVSTLNPFEIIETAVTRRKPGMQANVPAFLPEECLTVEDCVRGYTIDAATAGWRAADTGSLSPGKFADLIVLDQDIFACAPGDIARTRVLQTWLGGRLVWAA